MIDCRLKVAVKVSSCGLASLVLLPSYPWLLVLVLVLAVLAVLLLLAGWVDAAALIPGPRFMGLHNVTLDAGKLGRSVLMWDEWKGTI
jgi:uncharacterized membrane protein